MRGAAQLARNAQFAMPGLLNSRCTIGLILIAHQHSAGFCFGHDGILQSFGRSDAGRRDTHITWPWRVGSGARQFPISRLSQRRPRRQHPPRALEGQGQTAVRGRPIGGPQGHGPIVIRRRWVNRDVRISYDSDCNGMAGPALPDRKHAFVKRDSVMLGIFEHGDVIKTTPTLR